MNTSLTCVFVYYYGIYNSYLLVRQIVIAQKKEKTLTYLTFFDNRPEAFSETRLSDKEL